MERTQLWTAIVLAYVCLTVCTSSPVSTSDQHGDLRWENDPHYFTRTIRMPNAVSTKPDALLCHSVKLDDQEAYILKYEPHATKAVAHHMMVYGCGKPGSDEPYWPCGEMDDSSDDSVCSDGAREIVYAWAMDADSRELPNGVGFRVGGTTRTKYVVIQLHYKEKFEGDFRDNSGVTLHMTFTPQPKQAGYYVMGNMGNIPPTVQGFHMESACDYKYNDTIYPIGYRTHSHNLGVVTSGYRIRDGVWTEIGRMSPQLPQTFYNVTNPGIDVRFGDILASRCTMSSDRIGATAIGPSNKDEMCNFYILYYTYRKENLNVRYCFRNAQKFRWSKYLNNIPDDASSTDGLPAFTRVDSFARALKHTQERGFDHQNEIMK
ncbi:peptidylglycine alpha-hydroxylating monooxygenase-like [Mizuhopecten yessoensis]|uniref:peptidylglycine alpha-hydroxylating monooxygenase-like n=1 Tax=Mizuhopecten yessoensis TaxID=6573 RepID=UPI000B45B47D|nr:peptidylglycine alpha-hydroxylating monooxygenase-like [Mizuhopecten yessoensis]